MSKTIKLEDQVYEALDAQRRKGETFSETVSWLLQVVAKTGALAITMVRPQNVRSGGDTNDQRHA